MLLALTRPVSPSIVDCELTHLAREPIDYARAQAEHEEYERQLARHGATVQRLPVEPDLPDAVFVEDTAIVLEELAVITRPGALSRRPETASVAAHLAGYRRTVAIEPPGTLDGGDVLVLGRELFVGRSTRSNDAAIGQLRELLAPLGYRVTPVPVTHCLHLKSAVSAVADGTLLLNPAWLPAASFATQRCLAVDPAEPLAANALAIGGAVLYPRHYPRTRARLEAAGLDVVPVAMDELARAEAGMTCCSILLTTTGSARAR